MLKNFVRASKIKIPSRHSETNQNEGGKAGRGTQICTDCGHILFRKEWKPSAKVKDFKVSAPFQETICPACAMAKKHTFEGEITIERIPEKYEQELQNLVRSYGNRATDHDSQHRVLAIEKKKNIFRITTTENQLAVRLAKKIKEVFKGNSKLHISHSREPYEVNRVKLVFA